MSTDFSHITILGGGLLGGSLALALERLETPTRVTLWVRRTETADSALKLGIRHATTDLAEAVKDADLVVLAVPVGAMPALVSQALSVGLPSSCLITDVGSVKRTPHQTLPPLLAGGGPDFIGSHPMAGSERQGITAITADLFENAACLLTNDEQIPAHRAEALERFWKSVGCRVSWMTAPVHDALVARISHLPHIVAAAAARVCLKNPSEGSFGGGGLRDTTRVASGNPEMWAEIVTENREALLEPLRDILADLTEILGHLESGAQEPARQWLAAAKHQRDTLNPPS
jgi:prephenate dehydrogenase